VVKIGIEETFLTMSGGLHLEQYLDDDKENAPARKPDLDCLSLPRSLRAAYKGLESLPAELTKNFYNMREMDQTTQGLLMQVDEASDEHLRSVRSLSPRRRAAGTQRVLDLYARAKEANRDKTQLAIQTYELVDKHIRRLDSDLAKFEAEMKEKPLVVTKKDEDGPKKKGRKKKEEGAVGKGAPKKKKKGAAGSEDEETPKAGAGRKKKNKQEDAPLSSVLPALSSMVHASETLDMPVDPNEPTYCLCHQVSYGEMIACDRLDCPIEWFHFACVNLTTKPKGKWFCPRCQQDVKKKK